MSWILILLQLIPALIKIIDLIREAMDDLPLAERRAARRRLTQICKQNIRKKKGLATPEVRASYSVRTSHETVEAELQALLEDLKAGKVA